MMLDNLNKQQMSILGAIVRCLHATIQQYMPTGSLRDFWLWALTEDTSYYDAYLQATGIFQFTKMTDALFHDLINKEEWEQLSPYIGLMNAYLVFETISDNLALGLAEKQTDDDSYSERHQLLYRFNQTALARLAGDRQRTVSLLASAQQWAEQISTFSQSLIPDKNRSLADAYIQTQGRVRLRDLDRDGMALLVTNIDSGVAVVDSVAPYEGGVLVQDGLVARYRAVNRLLMESPRAIYELVQVGADAILVVPVVGYFITALCNGVRGQSLVPVLENGLLAQSLYDAAVLIRLLNDVGTMLIRPSFEERGTLIDRLKFYERQVNGCQQLTLTQFLVAASDQFSWLTRMHKDALFGEFNICLDHLRGIVSLPTALVEMRDALDLLAAYYERHQRRLELSLTLMTEYLEDDTASQLILRFLRFHERLYGHHFFTHEGEYAI